MDAIKKMISMERQTRLLFIQRIRNFRSSHTLIKGNDSTRLKQAEDEFRTYQIVGLKPKEQTKRVQRRKKEILPPRYRQMKMDQDWMTVWPAAETFKWSVVPFPVRQGFVENLKENKGVIPEKYANAELTKIPNFLHLTPHHIKKQCAVIKDSCTPWPNGLETNAKCLRHFPLEVISSDYLFSSSSVQDLRARTVSIKVNLNSLGLDDCGRDKLLQLVKNQHNKDADKLSITSDRCPLKKQNYDYIVYLLTVLVHESRKKEPWEKDKTEADMQTYVWDTNASKTNVLELLQKIRSTNMRNKDGLMFEPESEETLLALDVVQQHKSAVSDIYNRDESSDTLDKYKNSVLNMLNIK